MMEGRSMRVWGRLVLALALVLGTLAMSPVEANTENPWHFEFTVFCGPSCDGYFYCVDYCNSQAWGCWMYCQSYSNPEDRYACQDACVDAEMECNDGCFQCPICPRR